MNLKASDVYFMIQVIKQDRMLSLEQEMHLKNSLVLDLNAVLKGKTVIINPQYDPYSFYATVLEVYAHTFYGITYRVKEHDTKGTIYAQVHPAKIEFL